jgi:hypothetical protein
MLVRVSCVDSYPAHTSWLIFFLCCGLTGAACLLCSLKESLPQISASNGTKSSTRWSDAVDDDELEVERRRARPRSFKLGDMWPALKV